MSFKKLIQEEYNQDDILQQINEADEETLLAIDHSLYMELGELAGMRKLWVYFLEQATKGRNLSEIVKDIGDAFNEHFLDIDCALLQFAMKKKKLNCHFIGNLPEVDKSILDNQTRIH